MHIERKQLNKCFEQNEINRYKGHSLLWSIGLTAQDEPWWVLKCTPTALEEQVMAICVKYSDI